MYDPTFRASTVGVGVGDLPSAVVQALVYINGNPVPLQGGKVIREATLTTESDAGGPMAAHVVFPGGDKDADCKAKVRALVEELSKQLDDNSESHVRTCALYASGTHDLVLLIVSASSDALVPLLGQVFESKLADLGAKVDVSVAKQVDESQSKVLDKMQATVRTYKGFIRQNE